VRAYWAALVVAAIAAALGIGGCGRASGPVSTQSPAEQQAAALTLYQPCLLGGPMLRLIAAYQEQHPGADILPHTYKPNELPRKPSGPAVIVTAGDVEMAALAKRGIVDAARARTFAVNTYPLAVIAAAKGAPDLKAVKDLARPSVTRIAIDDPSQSSLGAAAQQALTRLGLWRAVQPKMVVPRPGTMVLAELVEGKADAAVVFKDCLFETGKPPKTIRIVGDLLLDLYPTIPYQVAPMKNETGREAARGFADFLIGEEGKEALRKAGLKPRP